MKNLKVLFTVLCVACATTMSGETTYKLQAVSSVSAGDRCVFVQDSHATIGSVSSSALQTTASYNTTGLSGTENYVWVIETATNGFYIKNAKSNNYLNNSSSTSISLGTKSSVWQISFTNDVALLQNKSNSSRFLGFTSATSYAYKAYATSNLSTYAHDITVYKLVEESGSGETTDYFDVSFVDNVQGTDCSSFDMIHVAENTQIVFNSISDKPQATTGTCEQTHYHFVGWIEDGETPNETGSNVIAAGTTSIKATKDVTYKAVWAQEAN